MQGVYKSRGQDSRMSSSYDNKEEKLL